MWLISNDHYTQKSINLISCDIKVSKKHCGIIGDYNEIIFSGNENEIIFHSSEKDIKIEDILNEIQELSVSGMNFISVHGLIKYAKEQKNDS